MRLTDRIQAQGDFLFRHRGVVPVLLLPALYFALRDSQWIEDRFGDRCDDVFDWFCLGVSGVGLALRIATVGFVPSGTSGRNKRGGQTAEELNTTGMYSMVRNPLYLSNTVVLLGFLLATGNLWFTLVGLLCACLHYERVTCAEEAYLARRYQGAYLDWVERTPAFVPRLASWIPPVRPYCWRTALRREYQTIAGTVVAFALLDYAEDAISSGTVDLELETTALCCLSVAVFLCVRYVHKRTSWLRVQGR